MTKIIVSIALAVILMLGINKIADNIYKVEKPEKSAYQIDGLTTTASNASADKALKMLTLILWLCLLVQI